MSFRPGALRDAGMVPLSSRETAKGGTQTPQTRFAQTVRHLRPNAVTRELRGTVSPDQGTPGRKLTAGSVENTEKVDAWIEVLSQKLPADCSDGRGF